MPEKRRALWAAPVKQQQQPRILWKLLKAKSCLHNKHSVLVHPGKIPTQNPPAMFLWTKPPATRLNFTQLPKPLLPSSPALQLCFSNAKPRGPTSTWFQLIEHKILQPCSAPQMSQEGRGEALACWQGQKEGCHDPPWPSGWRKPWKHWLLACATPAASCQVCQPGHVSAAQHPHQALWHSQLQQSSPDGGPSFKSLNTKMPTLTGSPSL